MATQPARSEYYVARDEGNAYGRLVAFAAHFDAWVVRTLRDCEVGAGASVVDVGCGPRGALPALVDLVGPTGRVVGLDGDATALTRARAELDALWLGGVRLVHADLRQAFPDDVTGGQPFDAAYSRLFLMHQPDPVAALRQIAALMRPGGHVVVHDWLMDPDYPSFDPPVPAAATYVRLLHELMERRGASPDVARRLSSVCQGAGLRELRQRGQIYAGPQFAPLYAACVCQTLAAIRPALLDHDVAQADEIDGALAELDAAVAHRFSDFVGVTWVELVAQVAG